MLLTFAVAFAFAGIIYSNLSWIVTIVGLLCVFVYSHLRFADEIRKTDLEIERTVLDDVIMTDDPVGIKVSVRNRSRQCDTGHVRGHSPERLHDIGRPQPVETVLPPRSILTMTYSLTPSQARDPPHHRPENP